MFIKTKPVVISLFAKNKEEIYTPIHILNDDVLVIFKLFIHNNNTWIF
jgi:hypothetical protein